MRILNFGYGYDFNYRASMEDNSFDLIICSHLNESFPISYAQHFINECHRLLTHGGILNIVMPDIEALINHYIPLMNDYADNADNAEKRRDEPLDEIFDYLFHSIFNIDMLRYWQHHPKFSRDTSLVNKIMEMANHAERTSRNEVRGETVSSKGEPSLRKSPEFLQYLKEFFASPEVRQWIYNFDHLTNLLRSSGFDNVRIPSPGKSRIPHIDSYLSGAEYSYPAFIKDFISIEGVKGGAMILDSPSSDESVKTCLSNFNHSKNFFGQVILNPGTLAKIASDSATWKEILLFHSLLATDEYVKYLDAFYRECVKHYGSNWFYLDIVNVLYAASKTIQPRNYLEIGVRRGRSVCTVARGCPSVDIAAFDMWVQGYAGMDNPGPQFVQSELGKHGHTGKISFINGNSHETIPAFFKQHPSITFDMITVDGDHTEAGAFDDLKNVIPHLSIGGILVFDDISHPAHPYLLNVWKRTLLTFPYLAGFEFTEMGYGVAFAIRKG